MTEPATCRRCIYNDRIIELTGITGRNGRVGNLEKKVERLESVQLKLMLLSCSGACLGGGVVAGILKVLS